jgi:hypothetical protein
MSRQNCVGIAVDLEYRLMLEEYCDELVVLADAAHLECDCDQYFLWIEEQGVRIIFSLSSSALATASARIQRYL